MKTIEFLSYLRSVGVRLWVDGDRLHYSAPKEILTPVLRAELTERKADILSFLQQAQLAVYSTLPPLLPILRGRDLPLSFAQQRLWFLDQLQAGGAAYNMCTAFHLKGLLNTTALEHSLRDIARRHEIFRTTFPTIDGQPVQVISADVDVKLQGVDLQVLLEPEREAETQRRASQEAQRPFDLVQGPLMRVVLLHLATEEHVILLTMHHIVSDGWSQGVFWRELAELYNVFTTGKLSSLPELSIQYADFVSWQQQWLQGEILDTHLTYWKQQLTDLPTLQLPTDRPRPAVQTFRGARQPVIFSLPLMQALKRLSQQHEVTLFMTLLAAFQVLLYRYTGQDDIPVGSLIANRPRVELEALIGLFINTLVLRTDLSGDPSFRAFLGRVRDVCLGAYTHQDLPFERLLEELRPPRDLSRNPLFQVMVVLHNTPRQAPTLAELTVSPLEIECQTARFDLTLDLWETPEGLRGWFEYSTDLFEAATIAQMVGHLQTLLEGIVTNPQQRLSQLPLLTADERCRLLVEWNATRMDSPHHQCIPQAFEAQVVRTPDAAALVCADKFLTYHALNRRANQVAHHLWALGVGPEVLVGLCMERSLEMVVGLLGILKAGGVYMPLDPAYPPERLAFMLKDAEVPVVLTQDHLMARLPDHRAKVICLDTEWQVIARQSDQNLASGVTADHVAHVLYTSGSTGTPKGVLSTHRATLNVLAWLWQAYPFAPQEVCCQKTSISFVDAIQELLAPLLGGIRTVLIPDDMSKNLDRLVQTLATHHVTRILLVPSLLRVLLDTYDDLQRRLLSLKLWFVGGEMLPPELWERFREHMPQSRLIHLYGASEVAADTTWYDTGLLYKHLVKVPIGRPITNTQIYVLDRHLQPVPVGIPGELHVGGIGLARGYLNRPELTAEKFIPHPFSNEPGARLYQTGDLARYLPDGNIEFLGRLDHQVKIRGFRIELGEIEMVLRQHPAVRDTVVVTWEDASEEKRLVAYVVPHQGQILTISTLRSFLKEKLPAPMVPGAFVLLAALPLTPNGKADRRALPPPDQVRRELENDFVAPRGTFEHQLTTIWEKILDVRPIGVRDNFFELGGHSLLAVRLVAHIEKVVGTPLPVALLFQAPTIAQLASILRQDKGPVSWSSLLPIHPGGSKPPFFWMHGASCNAFLPRYLGPEQPFYGVEHQSQDGTRARDTRVETIATHYLTEIRMVQPRGPYFLGGYSFGSLVAFEAAQQLHRQDEEVSLLVLLDPSSLRRGNASSSHMPRASNSFTWVTLCRDHMRRHWRHLAALGPHEKLAYVLVRVQGKIQASKASKMLKKVLYKSYVSLGYPLPPSLRSPYLLEIYSRAVHDYVPQPYSGRVLLFTSAMRSDHSLFDWQKLLIGGLKMYEIAGDHLDMVKEPQMQVWAPLLKAHLDKAQAGVPGATHMVQLF
jgi:amino acid adenylation domain-containing protein